jgi:hypothetical protein
MAKLKGHDLKGFSDLIIHEEAVLVAGHQGAASRLLQKVLGPALRGDDQAFQSGNRG